MIDPNERPAKVCTQIGEQPRMRSKFAILKNLLETMFELARVMLLFDMCSWSFYWECKRSVGGFCGWSKQDAGHDIISGIEGCFQRQKSTRNKCEVWYTVQLPERIKVIWRNEQAWWWKKEMECADAGHIDGTTVVLYHKCNEHRAFGFLIRMCRHNAWTEDSESCSRSR